MYKRVVFIFLVVFVTGIAYWLRLRAVNLLPIDYDEDDYLSAAIHYAAAFRERDFQEIIDYEFNFEHPPLTKLIYGVALLPLPEASALAEKPPSAPIALNLPEPHFRTSRNLAAVFGTLEVFVLTLVNPLAGLFLAINTWQIKYTSQIMLEPLPSLTSLLVIFFYVKSNRKWNIWLFLSALAMGLTVASKYPYAVVGCALIAHWISEDWPRYKENRTAPALESLKPVLAWGIVAVLVFIAANPRLWNDLFNRFWATLVFHSAYAHSEHVRQVGFPFWQPFVWIFQSVPWHPGVFLISIDVFLTLFAFLGFIRLWKRYRVYGLWLVFALVFLLIWPTKWPQYVLVFTAPLSLAAALGFISFVVEPLRAIIVSISRVGFAGWYN